MENTTVKDVILDKKMETYRFKDDNYLASGELAVTITLGEYRQLIADNATAQQRIDKANEDKYSRESKNEALEKENAELKAELYELKKSMEISGSDECVDTEQENEE